MTRPVDDGGLIDPDGPPLAVEDSMAYEIYRAARLLRHHLGGLAQRLGLELTTEQWFVLNRLRRGDGRSQTELGDRLFADRPSLSRMLASLEDKGLITRRPDPGDRRKVQVFLTPAGTEAHDRMAALAAQERVRLFGGFADTELAQVRAFLARLEAIILEDTGAPG